jgi:predicted secreted protein
MLLQPLTLIAMYLTIWWTVIFSILPLGVKSHAEAGIELKDGSDPGSPVTLNLKKKAITTTWVSAIIFVILVVIIESGWFHLPELGSR